MRRIKNKEFKKCLLIPWFSIIHGFDILRGGILDICKAVRYSFHCSPKDELSVYWKAIVQYMDQRFGIRLGKKKTRRSSSPRIASVKELTEEKNEAKQFKRREHRKAG